MLELGKICRRESVGLRNDRDQVDTGAQALHHLNVERLQSVSGWADKVQAGMYTVVRNLLTVDAVLLLEVRIKAGLDVFDYRFPAEA